MTVIGGRNGSGKSNLLSILSLLTDARTRGLRGTFIEKLRNIRASFAVRGEESTIEYHFVPNDVPYDAITSDPDIDSLVVVLNFDHENQDATAVAKVRAGEIEFEIRFDERMSGYPGTISQENVLVQFNTDNLGVELAHSYLMKAERHIDLSDTNARGETWLKPDCSNLLQVLNHVSASDPDVMGRINDELRRLMPNVTRLRVPLQPGTTVLVGEALESAFPWLPISWLEMASGTRHLIAILTLLFVTPRGSVLLIEEPESFLHPQIAFELFLLMDKISTEQDKQIVITSHSPILLEMAGSERLRMLIREDATGQTKIEALTEGAQKRLEQHGILRSYMVTPQKAGVVPSGLLLLEGDDDLAVWNKWLENSGLADLGVMAIKNGNWREGVKMALYLRHLANAGIRSGTFLLVVDSDGNPGRRHDEIFSEGLPEADFHVLQKKELEDYLLDPTAIGNVLGIPSEKVAAAISKSADGKGALDRLVRTEGHSGATATLKELITHQAKIDPEIEHILNWFREAVTT